MNREQIYSSVFAFFSALTTGGSPAFLTATRRLDVWEGLLPEAQPALLMQQLSEEARYRKGLPTIWVLHMMLNIYVHTGAQNDPTLVPSQILNPLLDAVTAALTVDDMSNDACTLGGLVSHAAIEGQITVFQGDLGDEEVARIPITILTSP